MFRQGVRSVYIAQVLCAKEERTITINNNFLKMRSFSLCLPSGKALEEYIQCFDTLCSLKQGNEYPRNSQIYYFLVCACMTLAAVPTRYQKRVYREREWVMSYREYYEYEKNYVELPTDLNDKVEKIMDLVDSIKDDTGRDLTIRLLHRLLNKRPLTCCHNDQNEWIIDDSLTDMLRQKAVYRHKRYDSLAMVVEGRNIKFVDLDYNMIWDSDNDTARSYLGGAREVEMPYRVPREPNLYEEHKFTNGSIMRERYEL